MLEIGTKPKDCKGLAEEISAKSLIGLEFFLGLFCLTTKFVRFMFMSDDE
jgi:hypothetical protein